MFPWSHVCKNNNWLCLWMAASTVKLVLNRLGLSDHWDLSVTWVNFLNSSIHSTVIFEGQLQIRQCRIYQRGDKPEPLTVLAEQSNTLKPLCVQKAYAKHSVVVFVQMFSRSVMCNSLGPQGLQHARLPCPSPSPGAFSNSCPLSWWCHPTISSSVVPFSSCLQSFPASGFILNPMNSMKNTQRFDINLLRGTELRGNIKWWNMHMVWLPSRI